MTDFDFSGLAHHQKLPPGDPRGLISYEDYPDDLQRLMDARLFADFAHRIKLRDATELERALLVHHGHVDAKDARKIKAEITFTKGVRAMNFCYSDGTAIRADIEGEE